MSIFQSSFFSLAGQQERLSNVWNTLKAAVTGQGVQSNTGNKQIDAALSAAASNPFVTAGAVATVMNPSGALAALKSGAKAAGSAFSSLSTKTKVISALAAPSVASALITSPKLAKSATKGVKNIVTGQAGKDLGGFIENPSLQSAKQFAKNNPALSTIGGAGLLSVAGFGGANLLATYLNTKAVKENTKATIGGSGFAPENTSSALDQAKLEAKTQLEISKIAAENNLAIEKERTKQAKTAAKATKVKDVPNTQAVSQESTGSIPKTTKNIKKKKTKKKTYKKSTKKVTPKKKRQASKGKKKRKIYKKKKTER